MHILLTNDDGITAPGLAAMYRELVNLGRVSVVAPDSVQSASAHAITINAPLGVQKLHVHNEFNGYAVAGRPVDCVKLALKTLIAEPVDLVVSGINDGANVGINVLYSGTVAAAAEGALMGIPSVAVSLERGEELDFARAARVAARLIQSMIAEGIAPGMLLNMNIPNFSRGAPHGVRVVPQSIQTMDDSYAAHEGPDGATQYWLQGAFGPVSPDEETDLSDLLNQYVTITPLQFDLTARDLLIKVRDWSWPAPE
ncbi:MAG: 5'/3'-nucleotidase SurE [bacterium]|nr:5'/3'-nucleotidase SurE [bacterium]